MLNFDRRGLYGRHCLDADEMPTGDEEAIADAVEQLEGRFETGQIGFRNAPDADLGAIQMWADERLNENWTAQLVIGIGGSSLGARAALQSALPTQRRGLETYFADNLDPESVARLFSYLDPETTLVVVVTKSGTTVETMSQFWMARKWIADAVGENRAPHHFVAITDPESGELRKLVDDYTWWDFPIPENVGGRFSVLTPVGLVPLALAGYSIDEFVQGARKVRDRHAERAQIASTWGTIAAEYLAVADRGFDQLVMMSYSDRLSGVVDWFRQLWAESLGKATTRDGESIHAGTTPIKARGVTDQHSQIQLYREGPNNKHITFLEVQNFERDRRIPDSPPMPEALEHLQGRTVSEIFAAELRGTRGALQEAGRPTSTWVFDRVTPRAVGAFMYSWQMITALAGELLNIDAFNQPGVELGKNIAHGLLGRAGYEEYADRAEGSETAGEQVVEVL